ncbi:hypothetical protein TREMEDRAFT_16632, partial [Tremella mesenterica DSM 1558]|uniref:uncharacterized protein n=1 Tax=Tremella mesenterica (strain ATCC 24925 / CBS 8224 / DSM 1558 / NBRC 9311 / NRRL Y-6157 / RJB 2259-6 / UBC 559-6) TaxID=578456 RepID=UPI00032D53F8
LPEGLDLNEEISDLLREGTKRAHMKAGDHKGAMALVRGELDIAEYVRWLAILWRVYDALELGLAEYASNPVLAPTFDPLLLSRSSALAKDITHLLTLVPRKLHTPAPSGYTSTDRTTSATPLPPFPLPAFLDPIFSAPPQPLKAYIDRLRELAASSETAPSLLAHAYVRYLGDLSGGQVIRARVKKAYKLEEDDGVRFFLFPREGEDGGTEGEKKRLGEIKDWYRRGMNEGVGDDKALKELLVKEANLAFALNTHIFSLI